MNIITMNIITTMNGEYIIILRPRFQKQHERMSIIFFMEKILKKKTIDIRIIYIGGKKLKNKIQL